MLKPAARAVPAPTLPRVWPHRLVALALVLAGGTVLGWPVAQTLINNTEGVQVTTAYVRSIEATAPEVLSEEIAAARAYNAALPPETLTDPWGEGDAQASAAQARYRTMLASAPATTPAGRPMGRVRIPSVQVDLPVFHEANRLTMSYGVGHMYGSSLPVGGPGTHSVLAAHTGLRGRTMFDRLPEVHQGQQFFIDVAGETLTYVVDRTVIVEPWQLEEVARIPGEDYVTLVTCYTPPGGHKQRLLVRGVRVPDPSGPVTTMSTAAPPVTADLSIQEWMWPRIATAGMAAAASLLMVATWAVGARRARRVV